MLNRREGVDLLPQRKHDNTAGMLSRTSADSRTACHNTVDFTGTLLASSLFIIILYITEGRLIRQSADSARTEGLARAEK